MEIELASDKPNREAKYPAMLDSEGSKLSESRGSGIAHLGWILSGIVHLLLLCVLILIDVQVELPQMLVKSGESVLNLVMEIESSAELESRTEQPRIHVHAPGLPQNHEHAAQDLLTIHRHDIPEASTSDTAVSRQHELVASNRSRMRTPSDSLAVANPAAKWSRPIGQIQDPTTEPLKTLPRPQRRNRPIPQVPVAADKVLQPAPSESGAKVDALPVKLPNNPVPAYPSAAYAQRLEGRVLLVVEINREGSVASIRISESSGVESLDRAALETVRDWRFQPATQRGIAVDYTVDIPIRFSIPNRR